MKKLALMFACAAAWTAAGTIYSVTDLGSLGGTAAQAFGLNASGQAVGAASTSFGALHAFASNGSGMMDLTASGEATAAAIDARGSIAGTQYIDGQAFATEWIRNVPVLLGGPGSFAMAINDPGEIAGMLGDGHAFTSSRGDLGVLPGGSWTSAYSINNSGAVAGYGDVAPGVFRGFIWTPTTGYAAIGTLGGSNSYVMSIGNTGEAVGSAQLADGSMHAFIESGGILRDLGTLGLSSYAYGINDSGEVVGYSYIAGESDPHAFLYRNGVLLDLNGLINPSSGWQLTAAFAINSSGQIAGEGLFHGVEHAFRLDFPAATQTAPVESAVPEPGTGVVLGIGLALIVSSKIRFRARLPRPRRDPPDELPK